MIFVALGTQKFQFNRLLQSIDHLLAEEAITDQVYGQIGYSDYKPHHFQYTSFMNRDEFEGLIERCDVLITHGGVATIIEGLKNNKKVIVAPRLAKYGEHVDNHQVQIAESFFEQNYVFMYTEGDILAEQITMAKSHEFRHYISQRRKMVDVIEAYLSEVKSSERGV